MSSENIKQSLALPFSSRTVVSISTNANVLGGFLLYGLGAVVWLSVLSKWDVSKAYPMVGLGFVLTTVVGRLMGEQVDAYRVIGVVLICMGIILVARS